MGYFSDLSIYFQIFIEVFHFIKFLFRFYLSFSTLLNYIHFYTLTKMYEPNNEQVAGETPAPGYTMKQLLFWAVVTVVCWFYVFPKLSPRHDYTPPRWTEEDSRKVRTYLNS